MADSAGGMPGVAVCETALHPFEEMFSALPVATVNQDEDKETSSADSGTEVSRIVGATTGAAKHWKAAAGVAGIFCGNSRALGGVAAVALPAGFGAPFPPAVGTVVGTATAVSCASDGVSCPNNAAKLPEVREPELTWPNKPADESGAALAGIADSMALVTINSESKIRADGKAHLP